MKTLAEIDLAPRDRAAIEGAVRIIQAHLPAEEIILFGSKVRGEDDPESDIDRLVLTSRPVSRAERHALLAALYPIQLEQEVCLSPLVVAAADWRSGPISVLPIRHEVDEQGVAAA